MDSGARVDKEIYELKRIEIKCKRHGKKKNIFEKREERSMGEQLWGSIFK